jgi:pyruvate/2-oxoglutarate dehydrogenase complex dihydrolipoamide acyltransferase (E2) component
MSNLDQVTQTIVLLADVNVAMAVAIDGGLITPTIIKAQEQDLFSISRTWKELVEKAKAKKLSPAEYSSGTGYRVSLSHQELPTDLLLL